MPKLLRIGRGDWSEGLKVAPARAPPVMVREGLPGKAIHFKYRQTANTKIGKSAMSEEPIENTPKKKLSVWKKSLIVLVLLVLGFGWALVNYRIGPFVCWATDGKFCRYNMPPFKPAPAWISHSPQN